MSPEAMLPVALILGYLLGSIPPISNRNARTRRSTNRGSRAAWCAPSSADERSMSMSDAREIFRNGSSGDVA